MSPTNEETVISYLRAVGRLEGDPADLRAARARVPSPPRRRPIVPVRGSRALALAAVMVAGSATLATATVLLVNPDPRPPARVVDEPVPAQVTAALGVLRRPADVQDRSAEARKAARGILSPYVVDSGSIRAIGRTPLGESAYLMYARLDPAVAPPDMLRNGGGQLEGVYVAVQGSFGGLGSDGPYPLADVQRGTAIGTKEIPTNGPRAQRLQADAPAGLRSGRLITGVLPDGVARVALAFRNGYSVRHDIHDNVLLVHIADSAASGFPASVTWLSANGETMKTVEF